VRYIGFRIARCAISRVNFEIWPLLWVDRPLGVKILRTCCLEKKLLFFAVKRQAISSMAAAGTPAFFNRIKTLCIRRQEEVEESNNKTTLHSQTD